MADLIDRQAAIDAIRKDMYADKDYMSGLICDGIEDVLKALPSAQIEIMSDGTLHVTVDTDISTISRVLVSQSGTSFGNLYYVDDAPSAQPEAHDSQKEVAKYVTAFSDGYDRGKADAQPEDKCGECDAWNQYKNYPRRLQWIPCSETEDLPEHEVLCCDKYGEELIGWLSCEDDQWICESDGEMMYDPIAWREKPEPWRGEEHD